MSKKILTICQLKDELVSKYQDDIEYLPLSNEETDLKWRELIEQYRPEVVIFGLQTIDEIKLATWRQLLPDFELKFIRKGTSLHRVDFDAASKFNIQVLNTPGVNAQFVADFVSELLLAQLKDSPIAVLGIGEIGKKVVVRLLQENKILLLYNRTHYAFEIPNYSYPCDLLDVFRHVQQVAICLPLNNETTGMISEQHISLFPKHSQLIIISPPRVLSAAAIKKLHVREDISVVFDHVRSGLTFIYDSLGHQNLRKNFIFDEKAAAGYECQYAMGEAAILRALS